MKIKISHTLHPQIFGQQEPEIREMSTGWLGKYYDEKYFDYTTNPPDKPVAIQIGSNSNMILEVIKSLCFAVANERRLEKVAEEEVFN